MPPEELAQLVDVAEILGVSRRSAARYAARPGFPEPFGTLGSGTGRPVWRRVDVEAWGHENPRRGRGRPPKGNR